MANGHPSTAVATAWESARVLERAATDAVKEASELNIYLAADQIADSTDHAAAVSGNGDWPATIEYRGPGIPLGTARALEAARADVPG